MPRTNIDVSQISSSDTQILASTNSTTIDATLVSNGVALDIFKVKTDKAMVHISNSSGISKNVTFKSGVHFRSSLGDTTISIPDGDAIVFVAESSRYKQYDNNLYIDFETGHTGTLQAYCLD